LRAPAPLAVHKAQLRWLDFVAAFCTRRKQGGTDLLRAEFRAAGHGSILRLPENQQIQSQFRHCDPIAKLTRVDLTSQRLSMMRIPGIIWILLVINLFPRARIGEFRKRLPLVANYRME
jgi:hypothetical protein